MVAWDPCQQRGNLEDPMIKTKPEKSKRKEREGAKKEGVKIEWTNQGAGEESKCTPALQLTPSLAAVGQDPHRIQLPPGSGGANRANDTERNEELWEEGLRR